MPDPYRSTDLLGPLVRHYRWRGGAAMVGLGLACAVGGLVLGVSATYRLGMFLCFALAGLSFANFLWTPRTNVDLHERGLVVREGKASTTIEWDIVESVRSSLVRHNGILHEHHWVTVRGGDRIVLSTGIEGVGDLLGRVCAAVRDRLVAAALAELGRGGEVPFGPIVARPDALVLAGAVLPWHRVSLRVERGEVWTEGAGDPVVAREVPNLFVLLELARQLGAASV